MTANAEIILNKHRLQIPEGAILSDKDKKASVEVPDPKGKEGKNKIAVNIGISNGAKTEVLTNKDTNGVVFDDRLAIAERMKPASGSKCLPDSLEAESRKPDVG